VKTDQSKAGPRVYLVEDSPIILNLLIELIETTNARIVGHADTAATAIADIAELRPDVVTVDILLGKGSGFDVLEGIATTRDAPPPVRIVLTNYTTEPYRHAARRLGVEYFFDKAREIREVLTVLQSVETERTPAATRPAKTIGASAGPAIS